MNIELTKKTIAELQHYVDLVESYPIDTFEQKVIKEYGKTESAAKVTEIMNKLGHKVEIDEIKAIIKSKPQDELHRIVRRNYNQKVKKSIKGYKI